MNSMKNWVKLTIIIFVSVSIILSVFFYLKKADLYSYLGKFYTKRDNYESAQKYYEKSYLEGNKNSDFRENYVNLLINSPLTIEAQQRLVSIAEDGIKDNAKENAKYFLYNLRREIHNKYPENYIQQASFNQKIIHWGKIPITYSFKNTKNVPAELVAAVNDAFDTWERSSSARLRFEKVTVNANIVVNFIAYKTENAQYGKKYVIAYTVPDINQNKLNRMDMVLNIYNLDGALFTPNQMYNTALHETFHALGFMGHSLEKNNIMYMSNDMKAIIEDKRKELTDADKLTLELLYKIKPDITNSNELKYDYISYPVLGDNAEINYAKAEEARQYIRKAPSVPAGYIDLAQTYANQKNFMEAIKYLEKAYRISTNDETRYMALYNLAVANFMEGSYELALMYVSKAKEYKEEDALCILTAEIYIKQGNIDGAIKEYTKLINNNPNNIDYVVNLTNIYLNNKAYLKARKVLVNYVKNNPEQRKNEKLKRYKMLLF